MAKKKTNNIKNIIDDVHKQFGEGALMKLGDTFQPADGISTGILSLDKALGNGIPKGRVVEFYGPEASGKTTLALSTIARCQGEGGVAAFIDAEHSFDVTWAKKLGVNTKDLLISQPDSGEQALDIAEMLIKSGQINIIVIDSVAALTPIAELQGEMGQSHIGLQARLMSQALRKLTGAISRTNCCLIFINQIRMKIGVMFGNPETTSGGNALKFYASVRIDVRRISTLKDSNGACIGNRIRARIVKNKVAPPFQTAEFEIMFASGISAESDILDMALEKGMIIKSGSWYNYGEIRLGQGRENAKQFLSENAELLKEITNGL